METAELKIKTTDELHKLLATLRENLRLIKFKHARKELKDATQIKKIKKDVARVLTILKINTTKKYTTLI